VVPFWVHEGQDDDISRRDITGTLRFAFGSTWIECSYALVPTHDAAFTLSGVNVYLGDTLRQLTWNRRPLWSVMPADLHDGALEQNVSLNDLRQRVSLRDVLWLEAGGAGGSVFVQPREREFFVHQGESDNGLVLGDFLGAYGFLGKYDVGTEEKTVTAGRTHDGGLTLHFLSDAQSKALHSLSTPEKDLNWTVESKN
jgi:hypothetical protein